MKVLSIFMMVFILATAMRLCPDDDPCEDRGKIELTEAGKEHRKVGNLCSPFCHCSRCFFSILFSGKVSEFNLSFIAEDPVRTLSGDNLTEVIFAIWQPPKLG